jgi:hypothetical protein
MPATERRREYDRSRVSVILGVTGTLELVIPLGARLGHPVWREALKEAGVDAGCGRGRGAAHLRFLCPLAGKLLPRPAGQRGGRPDQQAVRPGRHQLRGGRCLRQFLRRPAPGGMELPPASSDMVVTGGVDTFNDIFMYMCFSKTPALSPAATPSRSTHRLTAPSWAKDWASWSQAPG